MGLLCKIRNILGLDNFKSEQKAENVKVSNENTSVVITEGKEKPKVTELQWATTADVVRVCEKEYNNAQDNLKKAIIEETEKFHNDLVLLVNEFRTDEASAFSDEEIVIIADAMEDLHFSLDSSYVTELTNCANKIQENVKLTPVKISELNFLFEKLEDIFTQRIDVLNKIYNNVTLKGSDLTNKKLDFAINTLFKDEKKDELRLLCVQGLTEGKINSAFNYIIQKQDIIPFSYWKDYGYYIALDISCFEQVLTLINEKKYCGTELLEKVDAVVQKCLKINNDALSYNGEL